MLVVGKQLQSSLGGTNPTWLNVAITLSHYTPHRYELQVW